MTSLFLAALLANAAPAEPQAAKATTPTKTAAAAAPKVRCKRELVTGSLATYRKVCLSDRDWTASQAGARDAAQRMQDGAPGQVAF